MSNTTTPSPEGWNAHISRTNAFREQRLKEDPGLFAKNMEQLYHEQCISCPLPTSPEEDLQREDEALSLMPILILPLRVHIIRSDTLGCSDALNHKSMRAIVETMNTYWRPQAGIEFKLILVREPRLSECTTKINEEEIKTFITEKLQRGRNGKMMHKPERRKYFLDILLHSLDYLKSYNSDAYDIWFLDMVGVGSQGMCIDRRTRTVLMGERSTKGYDVPTARPHACLAKTMAHELGHALRLNHPMGRCFEDGQSQIIHRMKKNLMQGGADKNGGGGYFLEQWQICMGRDSAECYLKKFNTSSVVE